MTYPATDEYATPETILGDTPREVLAQMATHALVVLRDFPNGNCTRQEVDALAAQALKVAGFKVPKWRVTG